MPTGPYVLWLDRVDNSSRGFGDELAYTILKYISGWTDNRNQLFGSVDWLVRKTIETKIRSVFQYGLFTMKAPILFEQGARMARLLQPKWVQFPQCAGISRHHIEIH